MRSLLRTRRRRDPLNVARAPGLQAGITLRLALGEDSPAIERLAALYDRPIPEGPLLLAEVDGELRAALTLAGDCELMDPFLPTAALVDLLALRVEHLRAQEGAIQAATCAQANCRARRGRTRSVQARCEGSLAPGSQRAR